MATLDNKKEKERVSQRERAGKLSVFGELKIPSGHLH